DGGGIAGFDHRDHGVDIAGGPGALDQFGQQGRADTAPLEVVGDVDGVLGGVPVAGFGPPRAVTGVTGELAVDLGHHDRPAVGGAVVEPRLPVGQIDGFVVPDGSGFGDRPVVDLQDRGQITDPRIADQRGGSGVHRPTAAVSAAPTVGWRNS